MDRLERLRDRAYNQIIQILRFAEEIKEDTNIEDIKGRLDILEVRYQTFNEYEVELFEFPTYKSITDKVDQQYYKARALLTTAISSKGEGRDEVNATHFLNTTLEQFIDQQRTFYEGVNTSQQVRLPKIQIENFSGDYRNWASFHDLFNSTVHNNKNISNVHKLQMLKGLLSGDAASLIRHITVTENNYSEAWDKLCSRYNKMIPIVTSLTQTFFNQKPCLQSNGKDLRRITETADEVIRGLRALGPEAETRDPWLIHILLSKIDIESKQLWANESVGTNFPTFTNLLAFLNKRCDALEICDATSKKHSVKPTAKSFLSSSSNNNLECFVCKQLHPLFRCPVFKNQSLDARVELVDQMDSCRNCLKKGHTTRKCFSKTSCLICNKRHHTLLHPSESETQSEHTSASSSHHVSINDSYGNNSILNSSKAQSKNENDHPVKPPHSSNKQPDAQVLHTLYSSPHTVLPTAIIHIRSRTGYLQSFRALLDSGSQSSFVTEQCAQRLDLKRSQASISIYGLASKSTGKTKEKIDMTIHSRIDKRCTFNVTAHIIGNITSLLPTKPIKLNKVIPELQLADPEFYKPNKIDVLLGADVFFDVLNQEKRTVDGFPTLYSSKFGWLIAETCSEENVNINLHVNVKPAIQTLNENLHQLSEKFWEIEKVTYQAELPVTEQYHQIYPDATEVNNEQNRPKSTKEKQSFHNETSEERHKYTNVLKLTTDVDNVVFNLINKFSCWSKIMVFILQFSSKKSSSQHYNRSITSAEINEAETILPRLFMNSAFIHEFTILSKNQQLPVNNQLSSLNPFIDQKDLLRVSGRLRKSPLSFAVKHPVILPKINLACKLIVREVHLPNMHAGNELTLSIVRSKYWIIGARYTIKRCIKYCVVCIRYRFHNPEQKMADLPAERCTQRRVFLKIGLDYAGPLYIKTSKRRNSPIEKAYVAVFVCLAVRAVHMEVVSSLDTESFLAALKRFVARRGVPEQIWCDNGSNFVGANRELQQLKHHIINQTNILLISEFLLQKSIKINLNPPHAPHFGGLWESSVKSFKFHLERVANVNLAFEEMETLIAQIEALLNSRPLCKINDNPTDLGMLTPAHFLIGTSLTAIPEPALDEVKTKLSKWQNLQQRLQEFLKQWHRDYLAHRDFLAALQQRIKWKMKIDIFQINGVVLIREDNLHPCQWMRLRIINLHPGNDVLTRAVTLKTSRNEIIRPKTILFKVVIKK